VVGGVIGWFVRAGSNHWPPTHPLFRPLWFKIKSHIPYQIKVLTISDTTMAL
jgi:hypothetical protein